MFSGMGILTCIMGFKANFYVFCEAGIVAVGILFRL